MRDLYQILCRCCLSPLFRPPAGWRNPKGRGNLGVFFPIDNVLYSIAFETHIKMAEPIEMPFGLMTLGRKHHVLDGEPISHGEGANLGGET